MKPQGTLAIYSTHALVEMGSARPILAVQELGLVLAELLMTLRES